MFLSLSKIKTRSLPRSVIQVSLEYGYLAIGTLVSGSRALNIRCTISPKEVCKLKFIRNQRENFALEETVSITR